MHSCAPLKLPSACVVTSAARTRNIAKYCCASWPDSIRRSNHGAYLFSTGQLAKTFFHAEGQICQHDAPARRDGAEPESKQSRDWIVREGLVQRVGSRKDRVVDGVAAERDDILVQIAGLGSFPVLAFKDQSVSGGGEVLVCQTTYPNTPRDRRIRYCRRAFGRIPLWLSRSSAALREVTASLSVRYAQRQRVRQGRARGDGKETHRVNPKISTARIEQQVECLARRANLNGSIDPV